VRLSMVPTFLLRREGYFLAGTILLALFAAIAFWFTRPTPLTVAVGPRHGTEMRLMQAYARALVRAHEDIRLHIVPYDDVRDSAAALQAGKADLAVVRPDAALPDNGLTIAILHDAAVILAAPAGSGIAALPDLAGKRLGVVLQHDADVPLLRHILDFYSLTGGEDGTGVTLVPVDASGVADAYAASRIDAVAVIATPATALAAGVVNATAAADREGKVAFLPVPDGEALTQRLPELQTMELAAGTFGGRPKRPEDAVSTVGTSYRLVAREGLSRDVASSVTQHLFELRSRIARSARSANLMKAPDFEDAVGATSARLPNHPGAVDYFQREQQTFFDRYEDAIYLIAFCGGGLGSAFAWLAQRLARKQREATDMALDRLIDLLTEAREAGTSADLDALALEIEALVVRVVRHTRRKTVDSRTMGALMLALDAARAAVADRRRSLGEASAGPTPLACLPLRTTE
jgi:TRAP-type uncharacterized transport system substrate-binding protein